MDKPKLVITGASGFIGSRLLRDLAADWQVVGAASRPGAGLLGLELGDPARVERMLVELAPAAVVHAAAMASPDECARQPEAAERINVDGAEAVARACRRLKARLVFLSTDLVFDGQGSWYKETDRPRPINVYGRTKLTGEDLVLRQCPDAAVLRVATVYGRALGGRPSFLDEIRDKLVRGEAVKAFVDQWRTAMPCGQLSEMVAALLRRSDLGGIFHWAGATRASRWEFCSAVCQIFGLPQALLEPCRMAEARLLAPRPRDTSLDCGKLSKLLGIAPWTLAEGLERASREWDLPKI